MGQVDSRMKDERLSLIDQAGGGGLSPVLRPRLSVAPVLSPDRRGGAVSLSF